MRLIIILILSSLLWMPTSLATEPLGDVYWEAYAPKKHQKMQKTFISRIKKACPKQWQGEGPGTLFAVYLKYSFKDLTKPPEDEDIEVFHQEGTCCDKCIPIARDVIREYAKPTVSGVTTYKTQLLHERGVNFIEFIQLLLYPFAPSN